MFSLIIEKLYAEEVKPLTQILERADDSFVNAVGVVFCFYCNKFFFY